MMQNKYSKMVDNLDKSLFKGKDLKLVNQVIQYFSEHDLELRLTGSAKKNALEGNCRSYDDIDLIIGSKYSSNKFPVLSSFHYCSQDSTNSLAEIDSPLPSFYQFICKQPSTYSTFQKDKRYELLNPLTATKIDINFEGTKSLSNIFF
jgi:hypothetical protein